MVKYNLYLMPRNERTEKIACEKSYALVNVNYIMIYDCEEIDGAHVVTEDEIPHFPRYVKEWLLECAGEIMENHLRQKYADVAAAEQQFLEEFEANLAEARKKHQKEGSNG